MLRKGPEAEEPGARRGAVKTVGIERLERFSGMPADRTTDTRGSDRTTEIRRIRGDIRSESAEERKIRNIQGVETRRSGDERAGRQIRRFAETFAANRPKRGRYEIYRVLKPRRSGDERAGQQKYDGFAETSAANRPKRGRYEIYRVLKPRRSGNERAGRQIRRIRGDIRVGTRRRVNEKEKQNIPKL